MKRRDIYLKAAELVASRKEMFCCPAIAKVTKEPRHSCPASIEFRQAMGFPAENPDNWNDHFVVAISNHCWDNGQETHEFRTLLLCMMAAACEDLEPA